MNTQTVRPRGPRADAAPRARSGRGRLGLGCLVLGWLAAACGGGGSGGGGNGTPPQNLSYPATLVLLELDESLAPLVPSVSGTVASWSISPSLPAGLVLNAGTGVISGAPTQTAPLTTHTVQATNAAGSVTTTLDVHVLGHARFLLVANELDSTLSRISLGDRDAGRLRHAGFHVLGPAQQGPETLALHPSGLFLYAAHAVTGSVSVHAVDPATGEVSQGINVAAGNGPHSLAMHPEGTFLYVAEAGDDRIRTHAIEQATGALSFVTNLEGVPGEMTQLLIDPEGGFLLSLHQGVNQIQSYPLDPLTGVPSIGEAVSLIGGIPMRGVLDAAGENLYVALASFNLVVQYPVTSSEGTLGTAITRPVGGSPGWLALHPEGGFLYVLRSNHEDIRRFTVDPASGVLTFDADEGQAAPGARLSFDERGTFAYLIEAAGRELVLLAFAPADGSLSERQRVRTRPDPRAAVVLRGSTRLARSAAQLYVVSSARDTVRAFDVGSTGSLTLAGPDLPVGAIPRDLALDPRQRFVFVLNTSQIRTLEILPGGTLANTGHFVTTGLEPTAICVDPTGTFLFLIDRDSDEVTPYEILANGSLSQRASVLTAGQPDSLGVDPTGQFLYVGSLGLIRPFSIDPRTGAPTAGALDGPAQGGPMTSGRATAPCGTHRPATSSPSSPWRPASPCPGGWRSPPTGRASTS